MRTLSKPARAAILVAVLLVGGLAYALATQWQTETIGTYTVKRNRLTGMADVRDGQVWTRFADDPYADAVPAELLRHLHLADVTWGPGGLLCARVTNDGKQAVVGRMAFRIVLLRGDKGFRDRALRATVNFPPGETHAVLIRTNLNTDDATGTNIVTKVSLQPAAYSGI